MFQRVDFSASLSVFASSFAFIVDIYGRILIVSGEPPTRKRDVNRFVDVSFISRRKYSSRIPAYGVPICRLLVVQDIIHVCEIRGNL